MLQIFVDTNPIRLASRLENNKIHVMVISTTGTLRLAHDRVTLQNPIGTNQSGFPIDNALGPVELQWNGDLWAATSTIGLLAEIEFETANVKQLSRRRYGSVASQPAPAGSGGGSGGGSGSGSGGGSGSGSGSGSGNTSSGGGRGPLSA